MDEPLKNLAERTDEELMAMMAGADHAAAATLVARHQRGLFNLFHRYTNDRLLAEDLTQEVFLRVYKSAPSYEPRAPFGVWLYRIAKNLCFNELKARGVRRRPLEVAVEPEAGGPSSPHEELERAQRAARVWQAIEDLPERQRLALILRRFEGLSQAEAAEVMEATEEAVEGLMARAKARLKLALADLLP
jgi:RNA polymerase sigma-70 factor (ECF subfamily)